MWSILDVMLIVNIIKFKRMQGLNDMSFGEQSLKKKNYADIASLVSF